MTTTAMIAHRAGGWRRVMWIPIAAVVIGLGGGFSIGRMFRPTRPDADGLAEAEKPLPKGMRQAAEAAAAEKAAAAAALPGDPAHPATLVKVHLRSTPPGAQVALDGKVVGITPWDGELVESDRPSHLMFWKRGFTPKEEKIVPRGEVVLQVDLVAAVPARGKKKAGGGRGRGAKRIGNTTTIDPFN